MQTWHWQICEFLYKTHKKLVPRVSPDVVAVPARNKIFRTMRQTTQFQGVLRPKWSHVRATEGGVASSSSPGAKRQSWNFILYSCVFGITLELEFHLFPITGDIMRRPCLISPYHYRLDWLMWFAAFQVRTTRSLTIFEAAPGRKPEQPCGEMSLSPLFSWQNPPPLLTRQDTVQTRQGTA